MFVSMTYDVYKGVTKQVSSAQSARKKFGWRNFNTISRMNVHYNSK